MLLALTGYEVALLCVAAVFVAFALIAAVVVPRSRPEFPGRYLWVFVGLCVALFAAQIGAVLADATFGGDNEAGTTETTPAAGDAAAGKKIFLGTAGCKGCHTLADAAATGTVGPNLDGAKPSYEKVVTQVTNGGGAMPPFKGALSEQQIQDVAAYVSSVAGS